MLVGLVLGAHGTRGQLRIRPLTDNPERFRAGNAVFIQEHRYTLEGSRRAGRYLLVKLEGTDSPEEAQLLAGRSVEVPEEAVPPPPKGTYYHFQLLDSEVHDLTGRRLGKLTEILSTGSNDVYVVTDGAQELLVPAIDDVVVSVDPEHQTITVDLPHGLEPRSLPGRSPGQG